MSGRGDCAWISMTGCQVHGTAHQSVEICQISKCGNLSNIKVWKFFKYQSVEICQMSDCEMWKLSKIARITMIVTIQEPQNIG